MLGFLGKAQDIMLIGENTAGDKTYIYPETVKADETEGYISAWFLTEYKVAQKTENGKYHTSFKSQLLIDCDNMELGFVSVALYSKSGNTIENQTEYEVEVSSAIPGSTGWKMVKTACDIYTNGY